jgi:hypothetical protein
MRYLSIAGDMAQNREYTVFPSTGNLTLLLRIRKVPVSNLDPETSYPEVFVIFLSTSRKMLGQYLKIRSQPLLPYPLKLIIIHFLPFIRRYIACVTEKSSLNMYKETNGPIN